MPDESTRREIDKVAIRTLKEAGLRDPPFLIDDLLDHLKIDREFYNLEDPGLISWPFLKCIQPTGVKLYDLLH